MALLGWGVGKGSTPVDDWFQSARGSVLGWLLFFTDQRTVVVILLGTLALSCYRRRWLLATLVITIPVVAVALSRVFKEFFDRQKGGALAYPSGHTTLMVAVVGMMIVVVGTRLYVVFMSIVWVLLGILGQAVTYHYFTDALGGLLLSSSMVCLAAAGVGRTYRSPRRHSGFSRR